MMRRLIPFIFCVWIFTSCHLTKAPEPLELTGKTMGTTYSIKYFSFSGEDDRQQVHQEVEKILLRVNQLMSVHLPDSEISRFNADRSGQWFTLSPETFLVLASAQELARLSQGSFDVTLGPLINLWGFGPDGQKKIPTPAEVQKVRQKVGYAKLELAPGQRQARKLDPELELNPSSLAEGYGVDALASYLDQIQARSYLVEIGGEIKSRGKKGSQYWKVAIEAPNYQERKIQQVVELKDMAVSTSGDYRSFRQEKEKKYSHTIDPTTGQPVEHDMGSATVFASSCMIADAYSTAFMAMGPERALALANEQKIAAYLIIRQQGQLVVKVSEQFTKLFPEIQVN